MPMPRLKKLALATGLYRPARLLKRAVRPSERAHFRAGIAFYSQFVRPGDLCFDIGANVGAKTEMLLALGASVVSVEPQPELAREVIARVSHYGSKSIVIESALSERVGTATLHLRESSGQASLLSDWEGDPSGEIEVSVTTLDMLIEQYGIPQFSKIDVEGSENQVLQGLSHRVPIMTVEYHCNDRGVALARESISLVCQFSPIELNATGEEEYALLFPTWLTPETFLMRFPACVAPHSYGDMIIRTI
jgi:FkbM family methyltransferase